MALEQDEDPEEVLVGRALAERERARALRAADACRRAMAAAAALAERATWVDDRVVLDPRVLLGELLTHPTAKWIGFEPEDAEPIYLSKAKLRATRAALRPFKDLSAFLDRDGLHFCWHEGRGALNYFPRQLDWREKQSVFRVPLAPPVAVLLAPPPLGLVQQHQEVAAAQRVPALAPIRDPRARNASGWLGDILADLGLLG